MYKKVLFEELELSRSLPRNFDPQDLPLFEKELKRSLPEVYLVQVAHACIIDGNTVENKNGGVINSIVQTEVERNTPIAKLKSGVKRLLKQKCILKDGPYFWITDGWSLNYFHWITDALPRLLCLVNAYGTGKVLLPETYKSFNYVAGSLKAFGCTATFFNPLHIVVVHELFSCTYTAPTGNFNPHIIEEVKKILLSSVSNNCQSKTTTSNVYISRARAAKRKVENEEEVEHLLQNFGFQTIHYENLNWEQQLTLAGDVRNLVSIHGAGLTNCLFMQKGSSVLEFRRNGDSDNNCYYSLSNAMNLHYFYQLCKNGKVSDNLIVNLELLDENLTKMMNEKQQP